MIYVPRKLWFQRPEDGDRSIVTEDGLPGLSRAFIVLGEPGMGKTELLSRLAKAGGGALCTARKLINTHATATLVGSATTLIIDALDEVAANQEGAAVDRVVQKLDAVENPPFVLSCRVADWQAATSAQTIKEMYGTEPLVVHLLPLERDDQIAILADEVGIARAEELLAHFEAFDLDLLGNPQTLVMIARLSGTEPLPTTKGELFERAVDQLWCEHRRGRGATELDREAALDAAGAAFATLILTGNSAIARHGAAHLGDGELAFAEVDSLANGDLARILGSRLFEGGEDSFTYWHRRIGEFLGARWLAKRADTSAKRRRLLHLFQSHGLVPVSLRGLHAWLARDPKLAPAIIAADPLGIVDYGDAGALTEEPTRLPTRRRTTMRKPTKTLKTVSTTKTAIVRCAVYTRKSSEEGLEQNFNSLDAQREACEAYVASQKSEGWIVLPQMYDDGGISGGTMDRPALKRLLADVSAGLVDTVVVYKVDRLTRSLGDFAKIVEVFDEATVSFVSVTQSFNTTTSMGRLTLNMLLSFAQFEREVTGERIRDKIAASKAKGMWMGGRVPLGYEVRDRKLEIVEAEAGTVRHIFARYAELGSVLDLRDELAAAGITAKRHVSVAGNVTGGGTLGRGALYHLLQNRLYRGEIDHKGMIHPGQHEAIVDQDLWNQVQAVLAENRVERAVRSDAASPSLLAGLVRDEDGIPLTPTHANKKGRRYRYYVSHDLIAGRKTPAAAEGGEQLCRRSSARRIPATDLESIVEDRLTVFLGDASAIDAVVAPRARDIEERQRLVARAGELAGVWPSLAPTDKVAVVHRLVKAIVVTTDSVDITLGADAVLALARCRAERIAMPDRSGRASRADDGETLALSVPAMLKRVGMEMRHLVEAPQSRDARKPDRSLVRLLARAHRFRDLILRGDGKSIAELAEENGVTRPYVSRIVRLGFLAPDITTAILEGRQPIELSAKRMSVTADLAKDWSEQRRKFGFG